MMTIRHTWLPLLVMILGVQCGLAQVVQLPTFNYTTVGTTVTVPDRGSAFLGGIKRASAGQVSRGVPMLSKVPGLGRLFSNRGIGQSRSASNMHVTATIIDHAELDEAILGMARTPGGVAAIDRRADYLARNVTRNDLDRMRPAHQTPAVTVEDVRRRSQIAQHSRDQEAWKFYQRACQAEAAGKMNVAKIYYQMVARRVRGEFKDELLARIDALSNGGDTAKLVPLLFRRL